MDDPSVEVGVDAFLSETKPSRRGSACRTCMMTNLSSLNRAILHFNQQRRNGVTKMKWLDFQNRHLHPTFNYVLSRQALMNHIKECLDVNPA